jgi:hypothetical protein
MATPARRLTHQQRDDLVDHLRAALSRAQEDRPLRMSLIVTAEGAPEPEWAGYEREVMLAAVNNARAVLGLAPVELAAVEQIERGVVGSADYTLKFALRCCDLVLDGGRSR